MNLKEKISWNLIYGSLFIQLIILFIASFFTETSIPYFHVLLYTFVFYIIISVIIKINIIYRLLNSTIAMYAYFIFTIYIIYIIYSQYLKSTGFISCTIISLILLLIVFTTVAILDENKSNGETKTKTKTKTNIYWRNRLRKYEKSN